MKNLDPNKLYSVRTSFKLTSKADQLLESLANRYDITQKELLLVLMLKYPDIEVENRVQGNEAEERQAKTKVLASQVLAFLENRAREINSHRDLVLESLIFKAAQDAENENQKVGDAMNYLNDLLDKAGETEVKMMTVLGDDHPAINRMSMAIVVLQNLLDNMENNLKFNSPIDPDDMSFVGNSDAKVMDFKINYSNHVISSKVGEYLKIYRSLVPNTKISLEYKIPINSRIVSLAGGNSLISNYASLNFWDFGVKASRHIKSGDLVWIITGDVIYKAEVLTLISDSTGALGDAIGWSRQFKAPWKNVAALINVQKMDHIPVHLKSYVNGNITAQESANFYRVK